MVNKDSVASAQTFHNIEQLTRSDNVCMSTKKEMEEDDKQNSSG